MVPFALALCGETLLIRKNFVTTARDCTRDDLLGAAIGIHFRGVDQRQAEIDAQPQCGDLARCVTSALAHRPGAQPSTGTRWPSANATVARVCDPLMVEG